jgi:hypothetical protein
VIVYCSLAVDYYMTCYRGVPSGSIACLSFNMYRDGSVSIMPQNWHVGYLTTKVSVADLKYDCTCGPCLIAIDPTPLNRQIGLHYNDVT